MTIEQAKQLKMEVNEQISLQLQRLADVGLVPYGVDLTLNRQFGPKVDVIATVDIRL